jgi:dolichol-phosphate mannosyltransferase
MRLRIIIPSYNEKPTLTKALERLISLEMPEFVSEHKIIIVDDGSDDGSEMIAEEFSRQYDMITLTRHEKNLGKGAAIKSGMNVARGDVFLVCDADLELELSDIPALLNAMHTHKLEFVNGSRFLHATNTLTGSLPVYYANRLLSLLTSVLVGMRISDVTCGYKLFSRNVWRSVELTEKRFGFEAELLIKALQRNKQSFAEVPVRYYPRNRRQGKKLRLSDGFRILWVILKFGTGFDRFIR